MFACRLCLQLGIDDPEAWLAKTPRRVVNTWMAYWRLEPWGLPWHRHAGWMVKLDQILEVMLNWASGGKSQYKASPYAHWMPADYSSADRPKRPVGLREKLTFLARMYKARNDHH